MFGVNTQLVGDGFDLSRFPADVNVCSDMKCVLTIRVYGASFFSPLSSVGGGAVDCPGCAGVASVTGPVGDVSTKASSVTRKRISSPLSM